MARAGDHGAAERKNLRMLLPLSHDSLRIPDELAGEIGGGKALFAGQYKGQPKVWSVDVERDGDGAFLGRGWPQFADACGAGEGLFLVLRHRGRGLLTVKAFDGSGCLTELGAPPEAEATRSSIDVSRRPQFMRVLLPGSMEKMLMPSKIVEQYLPLKHLSQRMAIVCGPLGKVCPIEFKMNWRDVFFAGGRSNFLAFLVSTLTYNQQQQETPSMSNRKFKSKNNRSNTTTTIMTKPFSLKQVMLRNRSISKRKKRQECLRRYLKRASKTNCLFEIGPPAWIKKEIKTCSIKNALYLPPVFCEAIGITKLSNVTLKTSISGISSWQVRVAPYKNSSHHVAGPGWKSFCQDNQINVGDICTMNIFETTLWQVDIMRR